MNDEERRVEELDETVFPDEEPMESEEDLAPAGLLSRPGGLRLLMWIAGAVAFAAAWIVHGIMDSGKFTFFPTVILLVSYLILAIPVIRNGVTCLLHGMLLDSDVLASVATIGCLLLGHFPTAAGTMLLYVAADLIQDYAEDRAEDPFRDFDLAADTEVRVLQGLSYEKKLPQDVPVGSQIIVRPGELIPMDGIVEEGRSAVDPSLYFGDSIPRSVKPGSRVISGCLNLDKELTITTTRGFEKSYWTKVFNFLENPNNEGTSVEQFNERFYRYYTLIMAAAALLIAVVPGIVTGEWNTWLYRGFAFLMIACPLGFAFTAPLTVICGMGQAMDYGAAIRGGRVMENLAHLKAVVLNRTGTLTKGLPEVAEVLPEAGQDKASLLETAAKVLAKSNHRSAQAIRKAYGKTPLTNHLELTETDSGKGVSAKLEDQTVLVGSADWLRQKEISVPEADDSRDRVCVALDGAYVGAIALSDPLRPGTAEAVAKLPDYGIAHTTMLTESPNNVAVQTAEEAGVEDFGAGLSDDERREVLTTLESKLKSNEALAYVGNPVRDDILLRTADVGISLCGFHSERALRSSDAIIMSGHLSVLGNLIQIGRDVNKWVWGGVALSILAKVVSIVLVLLGLGGPWLAALADLLVILIGVMAAFRGIRTEPVIQKKTMKKS